MIEIDLAGFFAGILGAVSIVAGLSVWLDRRRCRSEAASLRAQMVRCRACASVYRVGGGGGIHTCPECGRENPQGRDRRLG